MRILPFVLILTALSLAGLLAFSYMPTGSARGAPGAEPSMEDPFAEYWYQGLAELNSYALEQARYGNIYEGSAVLIFVTEPFSRAKQVKLDRPSTAGDDALTVLKWNATRKFNTGIYPYSTMQSTFTPVLLDSRPKSLKSSGSIQEWCGHTFSQLNLSGDDYVFRGMSYFESEGDREINCGKAMLEDELWNLIRLDPSAVPSGTVDMIPSLLYCRFRHIDPVSRKATISLIPEGKCSLLNVHYPELDRSLVIRYRNEFPFLIEGWEENYPSGWGKGEKILKTSATRKKTIQLDYWTKNSPSDAKFRNELLLN